jgi:hypothetical protein
MITRSALREGAAALGVGIHAAIATWLIALSVQWRVSTAVRLFVVGAGIMMYGRTLLRFAISRRLIHVRRRVGFSGFKILRLKCAVDILAGGVFMAGAVTWLVQADTPERRVLGVLAVLGALAWLLAWSQILRGLWRIDDQPDTIDMA